MKHIRTLHSEAPGGCVAGQTRDIFRICDVGFRSGDRCMPEDATLFHQTTVSEYVVACRRFGKKGSATVKATQTIGENFDTVLTNDSIVSYIFDAPFFNSRH